MPPEFEAFIDSVRNNFELKGHLDDFHYNIEGRYLKVKFSWLRPEVAQRGITQLY